MVKQDAMNVFLGFYIPSETSMHLWDLDSDYYLHNRYLRPPAPYINRILYEQNRLNRSNSSSNRLEIKNAVSSNAQLKHSKIAKKYFIQNRDLLKLKAVEKKEEMGRIEGVEDVEKGTLKGIENLRESGDEQVEERDKNLPREEVEGDDEEAIGECISPRLVLSYSLLPSPLHACSSPSLHTLPYLSYSHPSLPRSFALHYASLIYTPPFCFLH